MTEAGLVREFARSVFIDRPPPAACDCCGCLRYNHTPLTLAALGLALDDSLPGCLRHYGAALLCPTCHYVFRWHRSNRGSEAVSDLLDRMRRQEKYGRGY